MRAVRPVIASNGVSSLKMKSVGSHRTSKMEKEGRRKGRGMTSWCIVIKLSLFITESAENT